MYSIWLRRVSSSNSEEVCIYNDECALDEYDLSEAKLSLEEGSAGSLTIAAPLENTNVDEWEHLTTQVIIRKRAKWSTNQSIGDVYWIGRLLNSSEDFYETLSFTFEGAYNYLMDTVQAQYHSANLSITNWIRMLILNHNKQVIANGEYYKIIKMGTIDPQLDPAANPDLYTDYETTLDCLNNIIEGWNGHLSFTYSSAPDTSYTYNDGSGAVTVNFDSSYYLLTINITKYYQSDDHNPTITFGENLTDFTKEETVEEMATVIIPRGAKYNDEDIAIVEATIPPSSGQTQLEPYKHIDGLDYYRTIYGVTNPQTIYLVTTDTDMISRFGIVCKVVDFSDIEDQSQLLAAGQQYLQDQKWISTTISINAIDAKLLGVEDVDEIKIGRMVHCYSEPHGLNYNYPCTGIEEDLLNLSQTSFTLGIKDDHYMSESSRKTDDKLRELIVENLRREKVIRDNFEYSDEGVLATANGLFETAMEGVTEAMDLAEHIATEGIKESIMGTLNAYDYDTNPYHKGYVHFNTIVEDYNEGSTISLGDIKTRLLRNFTSDTQVSQINAIIQDMHDSFDDPDYVWVVLLGNNDAQVCIAKYANSYKYNSAGDAYIWYYNSTGIYQNIGYVFLYTYYSNWSTYHSLKTNTGNVFQYRDPDSGEQRPSYSAQYYNTFSDNSDSMYWRLPYPTKKNIDDQTNYKFYCNRNVYESSSSANIYLTKNIDKSMDSFSKLMDHIYEIVISDDKDYLSSTATVWRWNKTGLYCLKNGYYATHQNEYILDPEQDGYENQDNTLLLALTADGNIVADRITVGRLDAGIIRAGYLCSQDYDISGEPKDSASFVLSLNDGSFLGKRGMLMFNGEPKPGASGIGSARVPTDNFLYLSNETIGERFDGKYLEVAQHRSKDWMFILGSAFGVDKFGQVFMREGIIGATGGIFDCRAYNSSLVNCEWVDSSTSGIAEYVWSVNFNTDAYRPLIDQSRLDNDEQLWFRFRIARYDSNNDVQYLTTMYSFHFTAGESPKTYSKQSFSSRITYSGTKEQAQSSQGDIYYQGELFPVFYYLKDDATEGYIEIDGHRYVPYLLTYLKIVSYYDNDSTKPQYENSTDRYTTTRGNDEGAVHVGTGYIYNGTIGSNSSFSLSGVNRTATMSVPDGDGHSTTTRDDWRLTVGSKFAVTDDGTLHCAGAYLRNAYIDSTVTASVVNANKVGGITLNTTQDLDGSTYTYNLMIKADWYSSTWGGDAWLAAWVTSGSYYDSNTQDTSPISTYTTDGITYCPQTNMYGNISFHVTIGAEFVFVSDSSHVESFTKAQFDFTFDKNVQTSVDGYVRQTFNMGSPTSWTAPPSTAYAFHFFIIDVSMTNEKTGSTPTWYQGSWTQDKSAAALTDHSFEGVMTVQKGVSNQPRTVTDFGSRDLVSNGRWIGGPNKIWARSYINTMHYHDVVSGLSSRIYKNNIISIPEKLDRVFDNLRPVSFFFNKSERHVRHTGFIVEEIGDILARNGISPTEFGAYYPSENGTGGELCYLDFIAINTWQIQKLKRRVKELEDKLDELTNET